MLNKIKNLYQNLKENVFLKYPVTMCGIWIAAVLMAIYVVYPFENGEDAFEKILAFVWIFNAGSLFTEEYFGKARLWVRGIGFFVSALISFLFVYIGTYEGDTFLGIDMTLIDDYLSRYLIVYLAWIAALCIYKMYRCGGESFEKYCLSVFGSVMRTSIVYGLFALGIAAIILIFDTLICDTGNLLYRLEVFLSCGLYIPGVLLALSKVIEEAGRFLRMVVKYVLLVLTIAAFLVIYLYIFKILFAWVLPSNEVFPILSWLFVCGLPIWTIAGYFKEDKLGKIAKLLPYAFIPFIILQGICIGLRIQQYGLTEDRYICCFLILAEIIYFILYAVKKARFLPVIFFVAAGLITVFLLAPVLKCDTMVFLSQRGRFEKYIKKVESGENIEKNDVRMLLSAYGEMKYNRAGEKYIDDMSASWKKIINDYKDEDFAQDYNVHDYRYVSAYWQVSDGMDVSGYSKIYEVTAYFENSNNTRKLKSGDAVQLCINIADEEIELDISDFLNELWEVYEDNNGKDRENLDVWLRENGRIPMGNGRELYVNRVSVDYRDDICMDCRIEGFVMEK